MEIEREGERRGGRWGGGACLEHARTKMKPTMLIINVKRLCFYLLLHHHYSCVTIFLVLSFTSYIHFVEPQTLTHAHIHTHARTHTHT
jgi:hypothetical protein